MNRSGAQTPTNIRTPTAQTPPTNTRTPTAQTQTKSPNINNTRGRSPTAQTQTNNNRATTPPTKTAKRVSFSNQNAFVNEQLAEANARKSQIAKTPTKSPVARINNATRKKTYKQMKINLEGLEKRLKYARKLLRIKRFTTFDMIYRRYHKKVWGKEYNLNTNRLLQKTNKGYNNKPSYNSRLKSSNGIVFMLNKNYNRYSRDKFYVPKVGPNKISQLKNSYNINRFKLKRNGNQTNSMGLPVYIAKYTKYQPEYLLSKRATLMEKLRNQKRRLKDNIQNKKQQIRNLGYKVGWFNWG
jgi:hypothetical protein